MLKVYIDIETNEIVKYEPVRYKEVIVDFEATDSLVLENWEIIKLQNSAQGKKRVAELEVKKELDEIEQAELKFLLS